MKHYSLVTIRTDSLLILNAYYCTNLHHSNYDQLPHSIGAKASKATEPNIQVYSV